MHLLYLSDVYLPRINGVSTSIQSARAALRARDHQVHLIAPDYGAQDAHLRDVAVDAEVDVLRVAGRRVPFDPEDRLMPVRRVFDLLPALVHTPFDALHIHTPFVAHRAGVRLAALLGLPTVATCHTHFEDYLDHYLPWLPSPLLRAIARGWTRRQARAVDALIVPSASMAAVLRGYGIEDDLHVIPTGIDLTHFATGDGAAFRQQHGIDPARPVIGHIGRVAFEKNIGFLIEMVDALRRRVPDVLFVIAGEGPALPALRRQVEAAGLGDHVRFVGYLARGTALCDAYCAFDAFVFASRTETQGLVLLEAMALGVPVVSTAVLGTRDVLDGSAGAIVVDDDRAAYVAALTALLADPARQRQLGDGGRAHARRWSVDAMADRLAGLYGSLAEAVRATSRASVAVGDTAAAAGGGSRAEHTEPKSGAAIARPS
ncbi:MAG: glycosyltransferase [Acidobacteriota bacterium]